MSDVAAAVAAESPEAPTPQVPVHRHETLYFAFRNGNFGLLHKAVNGGDESELLLPSAEPKFPLDWSPDQRFILYRQDNPETGSDAQNILAYYALMLRPGQTLRLPGPA